MPDGCRSAPLPNFQNFPPVFPIGWPAGTTPTIDKLRQIPAPHTPFGKREYSFDESDVEGKKPKKSQSPARYEGPTKQIQDPMFASEINISQEQEKADRKLLIQCNASMVQTFKAEALVALQNTHKNNNSEGGLTDLLNSLVTINTHHFPKEKRPTFYFFSI